MSFHSALTSEPALCPPALSQSRLYRHALRAMGVTLRRLPLDECGQAVLILRRVGPLGQVALMPGGPHWRQRASIAERREALRTLPGLLRRESIAVLVTNCATPLEERILRGEGHLPLLTGGFSAWLELSANEDTRRAQMKAKWRNRLVHAEAQGLAVRRSAFDPAKHGWLLTVEAAQRRARGYRGLPLGFAAAAAAVAPDQVQLFTAARDGEVLGAMLFLIHDGAASYHIGHIGEAGRAVSAHNLLLWYASGWLARQGVGWLDLGPVETEREVGLTRFKLGSGALPVQRGASCLYTRMTAPVGRALAGSGRPD